jgi:Kinesin motor domain
MRPSNAGNNVKVICRFRPLIDIELELSAEEKEIYSFPTDTTVVYSQADSFNFDKVYSPMTEQQEIFEFVGRPIVQDVLTGYKGTVIAYGQTGAGKSYTMMGIDIYDSKTQGIIPRAIKLIFESVEKAGNEAEFTLKCSMLEIYKEKLKDLCGYGAELKIKENKLKGIFVEGLTEVYVASEDEMLNVLAVGERNRTVASTKMNSVSSRSHQLFMLEVKQKLPNDSEKQGILNLVDLAGSEKINQTGVTGNKLEEAKKINLSLSALGNVIKSLTSHAEHIPYRDSKLTRLLQESLGGNYKTTLIVNCSPHSRNIEDTLNTLRFAQRAKTIKNKVHMNIKKSAEAYLKIIEDLKAQLKEASQEVEYWKNRNGAADVNPRLRVRRSSSVKIMDIQPIRIPELAAEDNEEDKTPSSSRESLDFIKEDYNDLKAENDDLKAENEDLKAENEDLKAENQDLKAKIAELSESLAKEIKKRVSNETKHFEISQEYNKLLMQGKDSQAMHKYLIEEKSSYINQIEKLKKQISLINSKFSEILNRVKSGEKITEWGFSNDNLFDDTSQVYTQEYKPETEDQLFETYTGISIDPEGLLENDCYANEICINLEENSDINHEIIFFEFRKQIINSGLVNCELFRSYIEKNFSFNLLKEKFNLKLKFINYQEHKIKILETMLIKLQSTHENFLKLVEKSELGEGVSKENPKKAKIARPIRGNCNEKFEREVRRPSTILQNKDVSILKRHKTSIANIDEKNLKLRSLESGFQLQSLYNQQLKKELELIRNERNTYKTLYYDTEQQSISVYHREKSRWKKYLEDFKQICNKELLRKQYEINMLNTQIAYWMNIHIENQKLTDFQSLKKTPEKKKNSENFTEKVSDETLKIQLVNSPLHSDLTRKHFSLLNSKTGDSSPPASYDE